MAATALSNANCRRREMYSCSDTMTRRFRLVRSSGGATESSSPSRALGRATLRRSVVVGRRFMSTLMVTPFTTLVLTHRAMQSSLEPEVLNQASNEIRRQFLSAERARTVLGWQPLFALRQRTRLQL